jgi:hypothetical protein
VSPQYRDIPGFAGYRVGSDGSIWSRWRKASGGRPGHGVGLIRSEVGSQWRGMVRTPDRQGRLRVGLCRGGKVSRMFVHRLVLLAFVGPCQAGMEACHYPDRDPANCNLDNLRWDTPSGNHSDMKAHGTHMEGEKHGMHKLTEDAVRSIRVSGESNRALAIKLGVTATLIRLIRQRKVWKCVR